MFEIAICEDDTDDKEHLQNSLKTILDAFGVAHRITCFDSGEALLAAELSVHLVFMDIAMEGRNGIEIGRQIYSRNPSVKIIYQTNFAAYCQEAVNTVHAFAFLEKPINEELLRNQIGAYLTHYRTEEHRMEFHKVSFMENGVFVEKPIVHIPIDAIYYFEYLKYGKKVKIITKHNHYEYRDSLSHLESDLCDCNFEICCRGILVNLKHVVKVKDYKVFIKNGDVLPLSQKRAVHFKERLNKCIHEGD